MCLHENAIRKDSDINTGAVMSRRRANEVATTRHWACQTADEDSGLQRLLLAGASAESARIGGGLGQGGTRRLCVPGGRARLWQGARAGV